MYIFDDSSACRSQLKLPRKESQALVVDRGRGAVRTAARHDDTPLPFSSMFKAVDKNTQQKNLSNDESCFDTAWKDCSSTAIIYEMPIISRRWKVRDDATRNCLTLPFQPF